MKHMAFPSMDPATGLPVEVKRSAHWSCVIGESGFQPDAYGTHWDMHNEVDGVIQPVDLNAPITPWLNADYLRNRLPVWVDQQAFGFLEDGVQYQADLPFQIMLIPHLERLQYGVKPIVDEMIKQQCLSWYRFFYGFKSNPVLPFSLTVRGAVPRSSEPLRPRPTADGGAADRKPRLDSNGVQHNVTQFYRCLSCGTTLTVTVTLTMRRVAAESLSGQRKSSLGTVT